LPEWLKFPSFQQGDAQILQSLVSNIVAHFWHHAILFERDTSQSVKEVGEVGAVQSSKR